MNFISNENIHNEKLYNNYDIIVVGSGLSGAVIAERYANILNKRVLIIEKRDHIGGNCYDYIDSLTGIRVSKYGAHLFHTSSDQVYDYIHKFSEWFPYKHKVYGKYDDVIFPIPLNITSINLLCNQNITSSEELQNYLDSVRDKSIIEPKNSEEYILSKFGKELYEKVFKEYTFKQWNKYPDELDSSVMKRIPIRDNFEEGYFTDKYQLLPKNGYTEFIKKMLSHKNIHIMLDTDYIKIKNNIEKIVNIEKIFYTGAIDLYYEHFNLPKLEYRTIHFKFELHNNNHNIYYQSNSVINYNEKDPKWTRIVEYKHFYKNIKQKDSLYTIISKEYTTDITDSSQEPYYPVPNERNIKLYNKYLELANKEYIKECSNKIVFVGRLANYKYLNMDEAILNSLNIFYSLHSL